MNWEAVGVCVAIASAVLAALSSYFTGKAKTDQHDTRLDALDKKLDAADLRAASAHSELANFKLHVAETYVNRSGLGDTEHRLTERIGTLEHTIRNIVMGALGARSPRKAGE